MSSAVFVCPEESAFYTQCLQLFFSIYCDAISEVHEFGSGDGVPMVNAIRQSSFKGMIHGYEVNDASWSQANLLIQRCQIEKRYCVHLASFFDICVQPSNCALVTNPPYLPALTDTVLYMKELYGGEDGAMISRKLLSLGYRTVLLMVSSFSNPVELLRFAAEQGYAVSDFLVTPLPFGLYSSQPEVKTQIFELYRKHRAFFSEHYYLLAGVIFRKTERVDMELTVNLMNIMQSLRRSS